MRTYARLMCSIWTDPEFLGLSPRSKLLYVVLISQPEITPAGVLTIAPTRWARLLGETTAEDVSMLLDELAEYRFVLLDHDEEELLVRSFIRHDGRLGNAKLRASISTALLTIRSERLRTVVAAEIDENPHKPPDRSPNDRPSDTAPHGRSDRRRDATRNQKPETRNPPEEDYSHLTQQGTAAAAVIEMAIAEALSERGSPPRDPVRYARGIRRNIMAEHGDQLAGIAADADPVAAAVLALGWDRERAARARRSWQLRGAMTR